MQITSVSIAPQFKTQKVGTCLVMLCVGGPAGFLPYPPGTHLPSQLIKITRVIKEPDSYSGF